MIVPNTGASEELEGYERLIGEGLWLDHARDIVTRRALALHVRDCSRLAFGESELNVKHLLSAAQTK